MNRFLRYMTFLALATMAVGICCFRPVMAETPPELARLEREVSLQIAHFRDAESIEAAARERLFQAEQYDLRAERAIAQGDYPVAEDNLLKAKAILRQMQE